MRRREIDLERNIAHRLEEWFLGCKLKHPCMGSVRNQNPSHFGFHADTSAVSASCNYLGLPGPTINFSLRHLSHQIAGPIILV
jgi:hypothetical protein